MESSNKARDMSKKRKWSRTADNGSYMFSVRIPEPLATEFEIFCNTTYATPSDVMRRALDDYLKRKNRERRMG